MTTLLLYAIAIKLTLLCSAEPLENRQNDPECSNALCVLEDALIETYSCSQATNTELCPSVYCECTSDLDTTSTLPFTTAPSTTVTYETTTAQPSNPIDFCPPITTAAVGSQITPTICASSIAPPCILAPSTITTTGSTITAQVCSCNGEPVSTVTPLGLCGILTAPANCIFSVPVEGPFVSPTSTFNGCACNTEAWGSIPTSSLWIAQPLEGGPGYCGGPICVPSAGNDGPVTCQCLDWPTDNTRGPYTNNPCAGYTYTTSTTGTCTRESVGGISGGSTCICEDQIGSSIHLATAPATCSGPVPVSAVLTITAAS